MNEVINEKLLRFKDVQQYVPFSRAKIYELIKEMRFPSPIKIGGSALWRSSDIQNYIKNL